MYFKPEGAPRRGWWAIVALVVAVHVGLLLAGGLRQVDTRPGTPPTPPHTATATELGAVQVEGPTPAPPSGAEKTKPKPPPALDSKQSSAINKDPALVPPARAPKAAVPTPPHTPTPTADTLPAPAVPATTPSAQAHRDGETPTTHTGLLKWPAATELRYEVQATRKGLSLSADSVLRWQPSASGYQARLDVKALLFGQRSQTSVGTLDPVHGLQPTRYGDKNRSEQATHFDRTRTPPALRFSANTPDAPLQPHTQDRLSVLLQLAAMFAGEPGRFGPGDTVALHTAGPRDADVWRFQVGATAPLALPLRTLDAVHLVRAPLHPHDNRVELWLAPDLGYVPVRILWTQANGDVVDQRLAGHSP